jgi:hypothetical protein
VPAVCTRPSGLLVTDCLTLSIASGLQNDIFCRQNDGENCRYFGICVFRSTFELGGGEAFFNILKHQTHAQNNPFALQLSLISIYRSSSESPSLTLLITSVYRKGLGHVTKVSSTSYTSYGKRMRCCMNREDGTVCCRHCST